jgi:16S rRNA (guanine966-N2)-methyltransferase
MSPRVRRPHELRIIGGLWRGRRWQFPANDALRPTPDRVRETLFNWLAPRIQQAACLDLFAGSGALGLEALSRGAGSVLFLEQDNATAESLQARIADWQRSQATAGTGRVERGDAMRWIAQHRPVTQPPFDIVFLDPPFAAGLLARCCERLASGAWLAQDALIYVECPARDPLPALPQGWQWLRSKAAGEVGYHLAQSGSSPAGEQ